MFTITSLDYSSCSDIVLNWKQLNSALQNAVASLFTVRFRPSWLWSVYWVNIYHLKSCFDAGMTAWLPKRVTHLSISQKIICQVLVSQMQFGTPMTALPDGFLFSAVHATISVGTPSLTIQTWVAIVQFDSIRLQSRFCAILRSSRSRMWRIACAM